ncbi:MULTISPECIES: S-adenosylmethionine:tRNA ribosyltransferase-isomerase [unclassified Pseudonocardia]|jgi:S-adenosylmethionine:tRNA ribosyltransferase-isomerase|uniref:S-adenosylmethionine:tRNA ribosyltransferase-isomerase n=1 Tax=unclassified Pseudonocardia TaxID=2619320 RepID=UPI00095F29D0|nr:MULTISPECIES: S-adenosylmethionine:tRNA ribosyltransferase-isomerase [unclassified Pseudonocardia]MBN9099722.1 S-adenosylmethionine:tRNA ribosyltransferase-isomerase [Pseudonocardia sp.]OJY45220.1 MAG: queuosine biosynthesis protein [Pseudonocardia sp. 73-21]
MRATTTFVLPPELEADAPPPTRDGVRLLVARSRRPLRHVRFTDLPSALVPGDLLVVNTSDTEPAAVDGHRDDGRPVVLHVSGPTPAGRRFPARESADLRARVDTFLVELRTPDGRRVRDGRPGEVVHLPRGVDAELVTTGRIREARIAVEGDVRAWLAAVGRPVRYAHLREHPPLTEYRTVFAEPTGEFASAESPSAGRPFTPTVLEGLRTRGVGVARLVLHTGVSSLEEDEVPLPERYRVPAATADAVNRTRAAGGRIVAVGTTATRALETVAEPDGSVRAGAGWTDLVLGPDRPARVVDGLVTGWHEPQASHLLLLEAVAGPRLVGRAYAAAVERGYRWHEFGDSCLLLPGPGAVGRTP